MKKLHPGEFLGRTLVGRRAGGLTLTMTAYQGTMHLPWHVHSEPTLFVLFNGQHRDESRKKTFEQPPLSVVFHPTTGPHTTAVGPHGMVGLNLELSDQWLTRHRIGSQMLATDYRLLDSVWAQMLGMQLAVIASASDEARFAKAEGAVLELIAPLVSLDSLSIHAPSWLPRAMEFLRANFRRSVGLRELAAELGIHPVYCARAFHHAVGCTVMAYLRFVRLVEAGESVLNRGQPLVQAAIEAGFADQAHMTRICSRTLGFTPGRLRRVWQKLMIESQG